MYDLESADRYTGIVDRLLGEPVYISEKLEGENAWATAWPDGRGAIGMRDNTILLKEGVENRFHKTLRACEVDRFAEYLAGRHGYGLRATVYAELLGPGCGVGNHYDLPAPTVRIFDVRIGPRFLEPLEFYDRVNAWYGAVTAERILVPAIVRPEARTTLRAFLGTRTVKEASDGPSLLAPAKRREGIVIVPLAEGRDDRIGRLILKQRSPAYLANTDL